MGTPIKIITALIAPLLLVGCNRTGGDWAFDQIDSGDQKYNSTKLSHQTRDPVNGVDLEFLQTPSRLHAYLNIHSIPIPPAKDDPKLIRVDVRIGEEKHLFKAHRHAGGQRLLLPDELTTLLIEALSQKKPVQISIPGYSSKIASDDFKENFSKLNHTTLMQNPFHLPF